MMTGRQGSKTAVFSAFLIVFILTSSIALSENIDIHEDILYRQAAGEKMFLDAYIPADEAAHAVVILVHGGGWVGGNKQDMTFIAKPLAEAGFTCFSVGYRLAPAHRWPACLDDVRAAVRWVKENASDYKGDPTRIAVLGYSAGGHLACMAAVDEPVQAVVGIAPPTDHLADSGRRGGMSECMQKLLDRPKGIDEGGKAALQEISPINYVTSDLPPYLLIHGTADQSVPYSQSIAFQSSLKEQGVQCDLITIQDAPHRISDWPQFEGGDFMPAMVQWLAKILGKDTSDSVPPVTITVCADGTADYSTVQAAVDAVEEQNTVPTVIEIKPGTYKELIVVPRSKRFVTFRGEDAKRTVLTNGLYAGMKDENGKELGTFRTPSVTIEADDFTAENITFENTAGDVGQALALTVLGDRVIFRNCRLLGWQDTLLDQAGRHYYENCYIAGHCDFIFGGGVAFFEKCRIHCLDGSYITAASTPQHQAYGYVFSNCTITGQPKDSRTYLGRPWRDYAKVVFLNTEMSDVVRAEGWHNWGKPNREKTAFYAEYNSVGRGANPEGRVDWSHQLTAEQAQQYTIENVLSGDDGWNPITGTVNTSLKLDVMPEADASILKKKIAATNTDKRVFLAVCSHADSSGGLYFAYSVNGLDWSELGGPFLTSQVGSGELLKGANLLQGPDGVFHLVWQTALRGDQGFGYAQSTDLMDWSDQQYFDLMAAHQAYDVVNPRLFYDEAAESFMITWGTTLGGNYFQAYQEPVDNNPRLWYSETSDFSVFTPAELFLEPGYTVEDAVIVPYDAGYALVYEDSRRHWRTLRTAFSDSPKGPWQSLTDALPLEACENPTGLTEGDLCFVYYHNDDTQKTGLLVTEDFKEWKDATKFVSFPDQYRLENVLKVQRGILDRLNKHLPSAESEKDFFKEPIAPIDAPFAMAPLSRPLFPDRVVDIRRYGAVADGKTYNTKAFADAIDACATAGGGRVLVPAGQWFTGPIHLKSNINLYLADGAEIIFSDRCEDYLPNVLVRVGGIEIYNYSPLIYARDCQNVAVTGPGKLNGNATAWWTMKGKETKEFFEMAAAGVPVQERVFGTREAAIRPSFLCLMNCRNVLLEGFTIGSGPNWTIHPVYCENVIIRRVDVITDGPNNDGIDPDSCRNVLIEHCVFDTGDDCVVLKSGYNEDGWRVARPTENVVMRYCSSKHGHGGLVIGSEMSGDVRNVYMHDCEFEGTDRAIRIKSKRGRGGVVENIWARDLKLKNMQREAVIFNMAYGADRNKASNEKAPIFRNFDIRNLTCEGSPAAIQMRALEDAPIENVRFENIRISSQKGIICENIKNVVFDTVAVTPEKGPVYRITGGSDVIICKNTVSEKTKVFLEVSGESSSNIRIRESDLSNVSEIAVTEDGASKEAVSVDNLSIE